MQARFTTQDQAESAIRKLASLRSDCFRLERASNTISNGDNAEREFSQISDLNGLSAAGFAESATLNANDSIPEFTLSANVPNGATEQARTVIMQAGGQMI